MGFLDSIVIPGSTAQKAAPNIAQSHSTGFLASVKKPTDPLKTSASARLALETAASVRKAQYLNSPTGLAIETFKGIGGTFGNLGKGFYDMFANPSAEQRAYEAKYQISLPPGTPLAQRILTAPGREVAKVITRFINPGLQPFATNLAEIKAISEKGGIADQVAAGKLPPSIFDEFAVLHKTNPQIVGDVAQAVLTAYAGGVAEGAVSRGVVREGVASGAKIGVIFGGATAASSGETDPAKIVQSIGLGGLAGGVLGGITSGIIPASKRVVEAVRPSKAAYDLFVETSGRAGPGSGFLDNVRKVPVEHLPSDYNAGGLYEPYTPSSRLPAIDMGPGAPKSDLPTINLDTGRTTKGSVSRVEPIVSPQGETIPFKPAPTSRIKEVKPVGTGEARLSRLAASVDARAVEEGLSRLKDLPEYQTMNVEEQATLAQHLIETNPAVALQIARGERLPPAGLHPEAVFVALENAALKAGDIDLLRSLAEGNLSTQATAMGQRIRLLGERNPESPVKIIRDIQESRQKNIETKSAVKFEKAQEKVVEDIKTEVKKAAPNKETWESFIKTLECGY